MNRVKIAVLLAAVVCGTALAGTADAHGRGRVGIWFGVPAPIFYPSYYYYPRYYYPPAYYAAPVAAPSYPTTYIEQSPPAAGPAPSEGSSAYWYYCRDSQTYYPYVQQCASQWEQVVPRSGPPS